MNDYIALAIVATVLIGGSLYLLRAARRRRIKWRDAAAAADEMLVFQAGQIAAEAGRDVDLRAAIDQGRS